MRIHPAAWSLLLLLASGIAAAGFLAAQPRTTTAPVLVAPTVDGTPFDLSAERGRVVVLDFFQVWCESCLIVEVELERASRGWDSARVRVVSVGLPPANEIETLRSYRDEHGLPWTVASDAEGAFERFGVLYLPTLVVVDADGRLAYHHAGPVDAAEVHRVVAQAVAREHPPVPMAQYSAWALAVAAGVASFFSPCAIGLLPGYVAQTVRGGAPAEAAPWRTAAALGLVAALGLLLVFLGIGGLAYAIGQGIAPFVGALAPFAGVLFVAVGVLLLVRPYSVALQRAFGPLTQMSADAAPQTAGRPLGHFLYGIGYGAGAAGCNVPVLLGLVGLAAQADRAQALGLVAIYAASAALLMVALTLAVAGGRAQAAEWLRRHAVAVERTSALFFVSAGLFLVWYAWRAGILAVG